MSTMVRKYGIAADNIVNAHLVDTHERLIDWSSIMGGGGELHGHHHLQVEASPHAAQGHHLYSGEEFEAKCGTKHELVVAQCGRAGEHLFIN